MLCDTKRSCYHSTLLDGFWVSWKNTGIAEGIVYELPNIAMLGLE